LNFRWIREAKFIAALAVLVVLSISPRMRGPIDLRWDAGVYYVLGTALAEGKGYRLLNEPGQIQETQYPPLLPASIAAVEVLTGSHSPLVVGKYVHVGYLALFAMYVFLAYAVARRYGSPYVAFTVGLLCAVNAYTHFMSDQATADLPFALMVTAFVLFATAKPRRMQNVVVGALCVAAYLFRTAGLGLMLAWVGEPLLRFRFRSASIRAIICLLPVAAWNGYIAQVERSPEYIQTSYSYQRADFMFYNVSYRRNAMLKDPYSPDAGKVSLRELLTERLLPNLVALPAALGQALTSQRAFWEMNELAAARYWPGHRKPPEAILNGILILIGGIAACGALIFLIRGQGLVSLTIFFSVVLICAWPWPWEMVRFLMPLNALSALCLLEALVTAKRLEPVRK